LKFKGQRSRSLGTKM